VRERARAAGDPVDVGEGAWSVPLGIACMFVGCVLVYSAILSAGYFLYSRWLPAGLCLSIGFIAACILSSTFLRLRHSTR